MPVFVVTASIVPSRGCGPPRSLTRKRLRVSSSVTVPEPPSVTKVTPRYWPGDVVNKSCHLILSPLSAIWPNDVNKSWLDVWRHLYASEAPRWNFRLKSNPWYHGYGRVLGKDNSGSWRHTSSQGCDIMASGERASVHCFTLQRLPCILCDQVTGSRSLWCSSNLYMPYCKFTAYNLFMFALRFPHYNVRWHRQGRLP